MDFVFNNSQISHTSISSRFGISPKPTVNTERHQRTFKRHCVHDSSRSVYIIISTEQILGTHNRIQNTTILYLQSNRANSDRLNISEATEDCQHIP